VARRPLGLLFTISFLALGVVAWLLHPVWLPFFGRILVRNDGPAPSDFAVVLGGDYTGNRIAKAAELVRAGFVPRVLVSGPPGFYGVRESDLAIAFIVRKGFPAEWFIASPNQALSTSDEARSILSDLRRRDAHSYILVTSEYHSARAARVFQAAAREMGYTPAMRVVASRNYFFRSDTWWRDREGQKAVFLEWSKLLSSAVGF
jgi:uncharacterized SAM-binding protein YcdF (DUF218 family)